VKAVGEGWLKAVAAAAESNQAAALLAAALRRQWRRNGVKIRIAAIEKTA